MERKLKNELLDCLLDCLDTYTDGNTISEELATKLASCRNHLQGRLNSKEMLDATRENMERLKTQFPVADWNNLFLKAYQCKPQGGI